MSLLKAKSLAALLLGGGVIGVGLWTAAGVSGQPVGKEPIPPPPAARVVPPPPPVRFSEERFGLVEAQARLLASEVQAREKPGTPEQFRGQLDRARARLDEMRSLIEEAEQSLDRAETVARLTVPGRPAGERLDARVNLALANLRLEKCLYEARYDRSGVLCAETDQIRATERLAAVTKPGAGRKAGGIEPGFRVADSKGRPVEVDPERKNVVLSLDQYPALVLGTCRSERTRNGDGSAFATAALWEKLAKGAHVRVGYAEPRVFRDIGGVPEVPVEEFLIPVTATTPPEYVLTRNGAVYRAFNGWQDWTVIWLQGAVRSALTP